MTTIDATPYPWPYDGRLPSPMGIALLLVAPQAAFAWMDTDGSVRAMCKRVLSAAERDGMPVIVTIHSRSVVSIDAATVLPVRGSPECELLRLDFPATTTFVEAPGIDGFYATGLDVMLWQRGITHLAVLGFGTETTVHSTLRSANDRGFECLLLEDACADGDADLHAASMSTIAMSGGIFGAYTHAEKFLASLPRPEEVAND